LTLHFHATPITPIEAMYELAGRCFCVSHLRPAAIKHAHTIGQSVMLDNGAYSVWKREAELDLAGFFRWCDRWLDFPTTWAVPPDAINAPSQEQDALLNQWPHGRRQAGPVWHMDEPIYRLCRLVEDGWSRVCMGSTAEYAVVLSEAWERRMDEAWDQLMRTFGRAPAIHMLRGMQCVGKRWPFSSVDSSDIAQNHHRDQNTARKMADRWDAVQCPGKWIALASEQLELL
jgi:hypothetical protein